MSVAVHPLFEFDNSFARELPALCEPWQAAPAAEPRLLLANQALAAELGISGAGLAEPDAVAFLCGNTSPAGASPVAQAYSGHQFGSFSPRLGDGRALLLGEVRDQTGRLRDLALKGSGRTPFARGGDGRAAVGPMLREYIIGEAMHALGIPTTRALAVVATGEQIARDSMLPGAVLARVAASHLRVGTFQYAAAHGDPALVRKLADYAIARHYPEAAGAPNPYLAFFESVVEAQASLVAQWMLVGFIHGVMNTDNMTISGETIDYGPCAFMDAFDPSTVFSSIDHGGRYAYGNQPLIAQWNLARLAETLLPLIDPDTDVAVATATDALRSFTDRYQRHWEGGMRSKLGLGPDQPAGAGLIEDLMDLLQAQAVDFTSFFRAMSRAVLGDTGPARRLFADPAGFDEWADRWSESRPTGSGEPAEIAARMDRVNPVYIPRNHKVEEALAAATADDMEPLQKLLEVLAQPFAERPGMEAYAGPAPLDFGTRYRTFCGT